MNSEDDGKVEFRKVLFLYLQVISNSFPAANEEQSWLAFELLLRLVRRTKQLQFDCEKSAVSLNNEN